MNMKVVIILVIASFYANVLSLECPSCRGAECSDPQTVFNKCSREVKPLPFGYESKSVNKGTEKLGCISLEYEIEPEMQYFVKQCILIPDNNLCESISNSLPSSVVMTNCEFYSEDGVQRSASQLTKRDDELLLPYETEGSGDDSTTTAESITDAPSTGDPITVDPTNPPTQAPTQAPTAPPADGGVSGIAVSIFVLLFTCLVQSLV
ncbi:uncharacterized protein LOC112906688 [Agrilus planipennis]|uniref:Uncharacterized protein LOC112906688 n=1 Tax=Agrilus planipennis TaxID=224129 RepID=A0A7F5RMQ1_AGRPL|nr:uncharacterized protein LOC112906688 [Agrilus planipennis]